MTEFIQERPSFHPRSLFGAANPKRKRNVVLSALAVLAVIFLAMWMSSEDVDPTAALADDGSSTPNVTVRIPERNLLNQQIFANGVIAARREMPVGVPGEGGQVTEILVEPGEWVRAGQPLATIDRRVQSRTFEALEAQLRVSQANAALAEAELVRAQSLVARGFVSQADIDKKTATRDSAIAQVRVAEARLEERRARNARLDIRAPADGLVLTRQVELGQVVSPSSGVLFRLARGGEMEMRAQLADGDLQKIQVGAKAVVTPVGTDLEIEGEVWQISPVINQQTRQGTVRIAVGYNTALRPGGFADVRLIVGASDAPLLPESAVLSSAEGNYVYIVGDDDRVARKPITVGDVTDDGITIASGLTGKEKVVLFAGAFLNPGDKIKPIIEGNPAPLSAPQNAPQAKQTETANQTNRRETKEKS